MSPPLAQGVIPYLRIAFVPEQDGEVILDSGPESAVQDVLQLCLVVPLHRSNGAQHPRNQKLRRGAGFDDCMRTAASMP